MTSPVGLFLRLAVVIGAATLVAGLAGSIMLALRPDVPAVRPAAPASSQLHVRGGPPRDEPQRVEVEWLEGEARITQSARRGEAPGVWVLPPVPEGRAVTLRLRRGEDGAVVHQVEYDAGLPPQVELVVDERGD